MVFVHSWEEVLHTTALCSPEVGGPKRGVLKWYTGTPASSSTSESPKSVVETNPIGFSLLQVREAVQSGNIPLLNWLFDRDSDVNEANKEEGSLFHSIDPDADESAHYEMVA